MNMKVVRTISISILAFAMMACAEKIFQTPVLTPIQDEFSVPAKGGTCNVSYTLENPYEGVVPTASATADWITDFNFDQEGLLKITVAPNSDNGKVTVERSADVTVSYDYHQGVSSFSVRIIQKGMNLSPEFEIIGANEFDFLSKSTESEVEFSIDSPADGAQVKAETSADWIILGKVADNTLPFSVQSNVDDLSREGEILLRYVWDDSEISHTVTVRQAAGLIEFEALKMDGYYYGPTTDGLHSFRFYLSDSGFDEYGYAYEGGTYFDILLFTETEPEDLYDMKIPSGEFVFLASAEHFSTSQFTTDRGYIRNFNDDVLYDAARFESGRLSMQPNATGYKIKLDIRFADGRKATVTYDGGCQVQNLSGIKPYITEDVEFSNADFSLCRFYTHRDDISADNFIMQFSKNEIDGTVTTMELQGWCHTDENGKVEAPVTYSFNKGNTPMPGTLYPCKDQEERSFIIKRNYKGEPYYGLITDGSMTVSGGFNNYLIEFNFTTDRGRKITGRYAGPIRHDKMDISPLSLDCLYADKELDLSYVNSAKLIYGGGWYTFDPERYALTGNDGDWTVELTANGCHDGITLNFITGGNYESGLQSGTYHISDKMAKGTLLDGRKYIHHGYDGMAGTGYIADFSKDGRNCSWQEATDGSVTVTRFDDGSYRFDIALEDGKGHKINGTWSGNLIKSIHERKKITVIEDDGSASSKYDPNTVILGY